MVLPQVAADYEICGDVQQEQTAKERSQPAKAGKPVKRLWIAAIDKQKNKRHKAIHEKGGPQDSAQIPSQLFCTLRKHFVSPN